jgi:hypothetical protein
MESEKRMVGELTQLSHIHMYGTQKVLRALVHKYGQFRPIIINTDNQVIDGWGYLKILKSEGIQEVDCVVYDIDENESRLMRLRLNLPKSEDDTLFIATELDYLVGEYNLDKISKYLDFELEELRDFTTILQYDWANFKGDVIENNGSAEKQISLW